MGRRDTNTDRHGGVDDRLVPDFDVVLVGYDRRQVARCLADLSARLDEALSRADAVELLQAQLCDAQVEIEQLRIIAEDSPSTVQRLSAVMAAAEELRERAEREAAARPTGGRRRRAGVAVSAG